MKPNDFEDEFEDELLLDPNSDRYRICPHPECGIENMVKHRSRQYCCDEHADDHYNIKRRIAEEVENSTDTSVITTQPVLPVDPKYDSALNENLPVRNENTTQAEIDTIRNNAFIKNIKILDSLEIHPEKGTVFFIEDLWYRGLDFSIYSGLGSLYNIAPSNNCKFMQMGFYRIYRVEYSYVLIKKIN